MVRAVGLLTVPVHPLPDPSRLQKKVGKKLHQKYSMCKSTLNINTPNKYAHCSLNRCECMYLHRAQFHSTISEIFPCAQTHASQKVSDISNSAHNKFLYDVASACLCIASTLSMERPPIDLSPIAHRLPFIACSDCSNYNAVAWFPG